MTDRPWTAGPWYRDGYWSKNFSISSNMNVVLCAAYGGASDAVLVGDNPDADTKLIALAPEMAEAILSWGHDGFTDDALMDSLVDKLKEIGND